MFRSPAPLLQARSVAIVGASERARWPVSIHRNLTEAGYAGKIYPINPEVFETAKGLGKLFEGVKMWQLILVMALLPAICEELAFRGFILSGLRHMGHKWGAIALTIGRLRCT